MEKSQQKDRKNRKSSKQDAQPAEQKLDTGNRGLKKVSNKTVITGGAGYFGFSLGRALAKAGTSVILYDINQPLWEIPKGVVLVQADVRHYDPLYAACEGADCVIHAAAYGMTGLEQMHKRHIRSVNVGGTSVVIEVCKRRSVPRLVYTSSINVVFGGQTLIDADEQSVPYFPLAEQMNEYSRTKSIAEQMVLGADGVSLPGGGKLHTCALRPPGIYGPEEQRHFPRIALNIERGMFVFTFGGPETRMNWVHVKNLVQAHILAMDALTPEKNYIAAGQAYFINDGEKVNLIEWLSPLFKGLGCSKPWIRVPVIIAYFSAVAMEHFHNLLMPIVEITPLVTRNEVYNIAYTNTFKIDKARQQLGYAPKKYLFADCVDHFLKTRPRKKNYFMLKSFVVIALFIALIILAVYRQEVWEFVHKNWGKYRHLVVR
ncbi:putative short-chain dehydrogenase/reductase family 42E member 2 [Podarcis muralis]